MFKKIKNILLYIFCCFLTIHYLSPASFAQKGLKVEKVDGVMVVSNPKTPIPKNGLNKRIVFKEELSIGVIEGDESIINAGAEMKDPPEQIDSYFADYV